MRFFLAGHSYFNVHALSRFRWRMLQQWVSAFTWLFVIPDSHLDPSYYCAVVRGVKGCCRNGRNCGNEAVCGTSGYVPCEGESFCCRKPSLLTIFVFCTSTPALDIFDLFQRKVTSVTGTLLVLPNVAADPGPAHETLLEVVSLPLRDQRVLPRPGLAVSTLRLLRRALSTF